MKTQQQMIDETASPATYDVWGGVSPLGRALMNLIYASGAQAGPETLKPMLMEIDRQIEEKVQICILECR